MATSAVGLWPDGYPCVEASAVTVQNRSGDLYVLPSIEVNQHNDLIDHWPRWTPHIQVGAIHIRKVVTPTDGGRVEIGVAINVSNRIAGLQTNRPQKLMLLEVIRHGGRTTEQLLHKRFAAYRMSSEWFQWNDELAEEVSRWAT